MGNDNGVLGFDNIPIVGPIWDSAESYTDYAFSAATDEKTEKKTSWFRRFGRAKPATMVAHQRVPDGLTGFGSYLGDRQSGSYTLIPGRPISAQTRLKNMAYEYPAYGWTQNPENPPYVTQVPGLPRQQIYMATINDFTAQPEFLQPITNLQIQNDMSLMSQFRAAIFGQAQQSQLQQNQQTMFPSIWGDGNISVNVQNLGE